MQPRTLEQILAEQKAIYQPQIDYLRQRQAEAPKMVESDIAAANAAQTQAYEDILRGAQRRGIVYSGIPLGEQAKYASTVYAPSILAARQRGTEFAQGLEGTILGLNAELQQKAREQQQYEQQFAESVRQFNEQLRRSGSGGPSPTIRPSNAETTTSSNPYLPKINRTDKGYQFTDAYGTPVTAAQYVQLYQSQGGGLTYRQLLQQMANNGDQNAKIALDFVGDDYRFGGAPEWAKPALEAVGASGTYQTKQQQNTSSWLKALRGGESAAPGTYNYLNQWRKK